MGLVWPWFVFATVGVGSLFSFPSCRPSGRRGIHAGRPPSRVRAGGWAVAQLGTLRGQGIKFPSSGHRSWCLEHGPGCQSIPSTPQDHPAQGPGTAKAAPVTPEKSRVCALGSQGPPWSPTLEPINCLGPRDEFVQSHFREEGDEIKSCNYLLKLQPLSRRTELLQTPLAGSLWMGERE